MFHNFFFAIVFAIILCCIAASVFFTASCYMSGDPNNMACYMISERNEIGVRMR